MLRSYCFRYQQGLLMLVIEVWFVLRMHGSHTLVKKAALSPGNSPPGQDETGFGNIDPFGCHFWFQDYWCYSLQSPKMLEWFLFQALIVYKNHGSLCCLYGQSLVQKSQVWLLSTQWLLGLEHAIERFCWFKVRGASQGEQVEICYLGHGAAFPDILGWLVVLSISSWDYPVMVTVASLQMECSSVFLTTL